MKKILILLLITLSLTSCNKEEIKEVKKVYKTTQVSSGIVNINDNFIGYTKGIQQAMLAPKAPGRITYMGKKVGDRVVAGELLASLDSSEARNGYNTAKKIVNKLLAIKNQTAKAYDEQIKSLEVKMKSVEAQISGATKGLEDTKEITKAQLQTAKTNLEKTKEELKTKKETILTGAKSSLTYTNIIATNTYDFVENLLGMDKNNDDFNDKIDDYLGMKNSNQLKETEDLFKKLKPIYEDFKKFYDENIENKNPSEEIIIKGLQKAQNLLEKQKKLLDETYTVLDNSIVNVYFPLEMINELKKQITTLGGNIEKTILSTSGDMLLGVKGSLENLKNFETTKNKAISLLEKQVAQYEAMAKGQVNNVTTKKELASLGLDELKASIEALKAKKEASLREIDTKIAEAIGKKDEALIMISNGNIIAPFSGIIVNKMSEEGQVTNAGMPIYEIADNSKIKIKVSVPVNIKKKLKTGQKLDISLQSINKTFSGIITNISSAANPITKKYEIEIILNNKKREIPVGEMAVISFNSDFKNSGEINSIRIPNSAIIEKFMVPGVYTIKNNRVKFKQIKIKKMGEFFSEIEGLEIGEEVITDGKENIYDGEILK